MFENAEEGGTDGGWERQMERSLDFVLAIIRSKWRFIISTLFIDKKLRLIKVQLFIDENSFKSFYINIPFVPGIIY